MSQPQIKGGVMERVRKPKVTNRYVQRMCVCVCVCLGMNVVLAGVRVCVGGWVVSGWFVLIVCVLIYHMFGLLNVCCVVNVSGSTRLSGCLCRVYGTAVCFYLMRG